MSESRRFVGVFSPNVGLTSGKPYPYSGYEYDGVWVSTDVASELTKWFTALPGRNAPTWNGTVLLCKGYWSWTPVGPDHWSEGESDANYIGPGVRAVPGQDTMYYLENVGDPEGGSVVFLYRRVNGAETLLTTWGVLDQSGQFGAQALKLYVSGDPPVLRVYARIGLSGTGPGYDPFELQIGTYPWEFVGQYTDESAQRITSGVPGLWFSNETVGGRNGDAVTHWSFGELASLVTAAHAFGASFNGAYEGPTPNAGATINLVTFPSVVDAAYSAPTAAGGYSASSAFHALSDAAYAPSLFGEVTANALLGSVFDGDFQFDPSGIPLPTPLLVRNPMVGLSYVAGPWAYARRLRVLLSATLRALTPSARLTKANPTARLDKLTPTADARRTDEHGHATLYDTTADLELTSEEDEDGQ